jgi:uncharacterized DUF497 family protein
MNAHDSLAACTGFDWDEDTIEKNWRRHRVAFWECEQVFFNQPLVIQRDPEHSMQEKRYFALGQTNAERWLFVAFTLRRKLIRVISARAMTRKERTVYQRHAKEDANF